tara:strand:- start:20 stop:400 length:381 start_codon:yes stop_codon:yes gene_type:complete
LFAFIHRFPDVFPIGQFRLCYHIKIMSYDTLKNYHAIRVRYLGATNTLGARVKLVSGRFDRDVVTVSWDYSSNSCLQEDAYNWLVEHGFTVIGQATLDDNSDVLFVAEFEQLKEVAKLRLHTGMGS